jgi:hypothetical protein
MQEPVRGGTLLDRTGARVADNKGRLCLLLKRFTRKGLAKEAAPLALIHQRQKQFQRRMTRHWLDACTTRSGRHSRRGAVEGRRN